MCGVYFSIMCTTHPNLVCLLFVPALYIYIPLSNLKNFSFTCHHVRHLRFLVNEITISLIE